MKVSVVYETATGRIRRIIKSDGNHALIASVQHDETMMAVPFETYETSNAHALLAYVQAHLDGAIP